jgi:ISXO2-like transposase domain
MVERGGEVLTRQVRGRRIKDVVPTIVEWIAEGSRVHTDKGKSYGDLREHGFQHEWVDHSKKEYVRGDVHVNTIEGFWGALKRGINWTYVWVSAKHLQKYLWEFEYRHNLRAEPWLMFQLLLEAFPRASRWPSHGEVV